MKVTICGSSAFSEKMVECKNKLNQMGHEAILHPSYEEFVAGKIQNSAKELETVAAKMQYDFIKWYYNAILNSDAILVLNLEKSNIRNYVGGNTLMEIGFAHVHGKKVFLFNPVPEISYKDEIAAMVSDILNGDLGKIK